MVYHRAHLARGGFTLAVGLHVYVDQSESDVRSFSGHEIISIDGEAVYRLDYHGGLIKP